MGSGDLFVVNQDRESTTRRLANRENPKTDNIWEPSNEDQLSFISQESVTCQGQISILLSKDEEDFEVDSTVLSSSRSSHNELRSSTGFLPGDRDYKDHSNEVSHRSATKKISLKRSLGEGAEEYGDGFQTPTKLMHSSSSTRITCPPAPKKPKAEPLRNRKRRNLQLDFTNEVESVLILLTDGVRKMKKGRDASSFGASMKVE